jgi:hypothetical protein
MNLGGWFAEVLMVLSFSKRTQWAIVLGVVSFLVMNILGHSQLANFELQGAMAPFTEVIKDKLLSKYDKAAYGCLAGFWLLAFKLYRKDKKNFYRFF